MYSCQVFMEGVDSVEKTSFCGCERAGYPCLIESGIDDDVLRGTLSTNILVVFCLEDAKGLRVLQRFL